MYRKVLVPIALDHSRDTAAAFDVARALAAEGAEIIALTVIEDIPAYVSTYLPEGHADTLRAEAKAELTAELGGVRDVKPMVIRGHAGRAIVDFAAEQGVDCIIIASHRPGLQDYFIGSTANRVVRYAPCAVHVLR